MTWLLNWLAYHLNGSQSLPKLTSQLIWAGRDFYHTDATTVLMATQVTETVAKATWTDSPYVCKADKQHAYGALV